MTKNFHKILVKKKKKIIIIQIIYIALFISNQKYIIMKYITHFNVIIYKLYTINVTVNQICIYK